MFSSVIQSSLSEHSQLLLDHCWSSTLRSGRLIYLKAFDDYRPYNVDLLKIHWGCMHLLILSVSDDLVWTDEKREESEAA